MNFLENLASEWYEYRHKCFIRRNVRYGKRKKGGYDNELDILAYDPQTQNLVHIEPSSDALSWRERKERYLKKKFIYSHDDYEKILNCKIKSVKKIALVGFSKKPTTDLEWGAGIKVKPVPIFLNEIAEEIRSEKGINNMAIPENYPLLRAIQATLNWCVD